MLLSLKVNNAWNFKRYATSKGLTHVFPTQVFKGQYLWRMTHRLLPPLPPPPPFLLLPLLLLISVLLLCLRHVLHLHYWQTSSSCVYREMKNWSYFLKLFRGTSYMNPESLSLLPCSLPNSWSFYIIVILCTHLYCACICIHMYVHVHITSWVQLAFLSATIACYLMKV